MTQIRFDDQACQKFQAKLDSYIDDELLTETNIELMHHFERCAACTREVEERRMMRLRLRSAVRQSPVPPNLEDRVRSRLRQANQAPPPTFYLMAIAATVAVGFGIILH